MNRSILFDPDFGSFSGYPPEMSAGDRNQAPLDFKTEKSKTSQIKRNVPAMVQHGRTMLKSRLRQKL